MNRGLIVKSIREVWFVTVICGVGLLLFEIFLTYVLHTFSSQFGAQFMQMGFFRVIIQSLLGADIGQNFSANAINGLAWVHPMVLALIWAHEISICTRLPAAEIDHGTIDLLFGLPISRTQMIINECVVFSAAGMLVIALGVMGQLIGSTMIPPEARIGFGTIIVVVTNLYCMYLAIGGLATLISVCSNRRGRAVAVTFGIVLLSFFLNFLAQFWAPAEGTAFLSILHYYKPVPIITQSTWPLQDMVILIMVGLIFWGTAIGVYRRRDICTV